MESIPPGSVDGLSPNFVRFEPFVLDPGLYLAALIEAKPSNRSGADDDDHDEPDELKGDTDDEQK